MSEWAAAGPEAVVRRRAGYEFPWDITCALALFRIFADPRIARLLAAASEFEALGPPGRAVS